MKRVSVVIPALNEEKTIGQVIDLIKMNKNVGEIITVDNCSTDNTEKIAQEKGSRVIFCEKQGKGYAMETGLRNANYDILAFVDADIKAYDKDLLDKITQPIIDDKADFVKSTFKRAGGRVTELVAKPLLELLFPNIQDFEQPLSGIIAGKKIFFDKITFEKDYGVDIGILLDMIKINARIEQVHIGEIINNSHEWEYLSKMSKEVANAILKRANYIK